MTAFSSIAETGLADRFRYLPTDEQLALFWFIYTEMGKSITPAAPGASTVSPEIAGGLYDQVKQLSFEEQLQVQRDLVSGTNCLICREYGSLSETTKLLFWYLLAEGMTKSEIIPFPDDYKLSGEAESLFNEIKGLEFSQQITLFRDIVAPMGVDPESAPHDWKTGL